MLIGLDGEWPVAQKDAAAADAPPAYNYTYVNFVGKSKYKGFPGTDRESPALVAEAVAEIREQLKLTKVFITGHSQGGFLTYSCLMNYPELFDGAMPISAGLIIQCEPTAYEDAKVRQQQRKRPLVILHGGQDPLVSVSMAKAAYESFLEDGFPMLRLMIVKDAGHPFIAMPFEEGIRWMESMTSDDPRALLASAERAFGRKEYRDAVVLPAAGPGPGRDGKAGRRDRGAAAEARTTCGRPGQDAGGDRSGGPTATGWVADFDAFRQQFEFTDAAARRDGRIRQAPQGARSPAEKRWADARKAFKDGDKAEGYRICTEIVEKYYASTYYRYAKQTLEERK